MNTLLPNRIMNSPFRGVARALLLMAGRISGGVNRIRRNSDPRRGRISAALLTHSSSRDNEERHMSADRNKVMWPAARLWPLFACALVTSAPYPLAVRAQNSAPNVQYTHKTVDLGLRGNLTVNPSTWAMGSGDYNFEAWIKVASNPAAKLRAIFQKDA